MPDSFSLFLFKECLKHMNCGLLPGEGLILSHRLNVLSPYSLHPLPSPYGHLTSYAKKLNKQNMQH